MWLKVLTAGVPALVKAIRGGSRVKHIRKAWDGAYREWAKANEDAIVTEQEMVAFIIRFLEALSVSATEVRRE